MLWKVRALCAIMAITGAISLGTSGRTATATAPLSIDWAWCESGNGANSWRYFGCEATVSGGTGSYTYSWVGIQNAGFSPPADQSYANGTCAVNKTAKVQLTVSDSGGASITRYVTFRCPYNPF